MSRYLFWAVVMAAITLFLYDIKYNVHTAQKETKRLEIELVKERERLQMVELEWTALTRPERIKALAAKHLTLVPIASEQVMMRDAAMWKASQVSVQHNGITPVFMREATLD